MYRSDEDMNRIQELEDENDRLGDQLRATTKEHNDRVERLERLIALALDRANMTREKLENALEELEDKALENSAFNMGWAGRTSLESNK